MAKYDLVLCICAIITSSQQLKELSIILNSLINFVIYADSRARLVAGSFQGHTGHVDGKPSDARFNHPKGVTMDDKGNVYVADTSNLAIRKIGEAGLFPFLEISF